MDNLENTRAGGDNPSKSQEDNEEQLEEINESSSNLEEQQNNESDVLPSLVKDEAQTSAKNEENEDNKENDKSQKPKVFQTIHEQYSTLCLAKINSAQEPWPKDAKLFQPYEVEQILLPDNANCLAVQAFLKMCNLEFAVEPRPNAEAMSPSGKVPFLKAGAFVVSELEGIVSFVNNKGISLTEKLDAEMKSDMRAYMSLIHNVIEVAELYICWVDKETYDQVTSVRNGSIYPWPLNHIQNRSKKAQVCKKLKVLQWYKKTPAEVLQEVENCCQALSDRLEGKEYFFGSSPTELDALVFGHLFTILTTPLPKNDLANTIRKYPILLDLVQKIEKQYFKRD